MGNVSTAPYSGSIEVVAGPHRLTIAEPGCAPRDLEINVAEGTEPVPINTTGPCLPPGTITSATPVDPGTGAEGELAYQQETNTPAWIVTGVGIALAVAGGVFVGTHVAAANRRDDLIAEDPNRFDARPARARRASTAGTADHRRAASRTLAGKSDHTIAC